MKKLLILLPLLMFVIASCVEDDGQQTAESSQQPSHAAGMEDVDHASIIENAVFTDLDGNEVTLADFSGKVLVIDFWETWCGPCLQVFPSLNEIRGEYPDDFEVLAVTIGMTEGPEEARAFKENHDYDFYYLYDQNNVSDELGIMSIPFKMYIDPEGNYIKHEIGSRGRQGDYESAKSVLLEYISD